MYGYDPDSCFLLEQDGTIQGVLFGQRMKSEFYVHEFFVSEDVRGRTVNRILLNYAMQLADNAGLKLLRGKARGNLIRYYLRMEIALETLAPIEHYLVRYDLEVK